LIEVEEEAAVAAEEVTEVVEVAEEAAEDPVEELVLVENLKQESNLIDMLVFLLLKERRNI
jgi:hypothetical protein